MCHPGRELAHRLHLLRLPQLRFQSKPLRDVKGVALHNLTHQNRKERPGERPPLQREFKPRRALARAQADLDNLLHARGQNLARMIFAQKTRRLLGRVVEIGQRAVGGQFENRIRAVEREGSQLLNFCFGRFALGNVAIIHDYGLNPRLAEQIFGRAFCPSPRTVLVPNPAFNSHYVARLLRQSAHQTHRPLRVFRMNQIEKAATHKFLVAVTHDPLGRWSRIEHNS